VEGKFQWLTVVHGAHYVCRVIIDGRLVFHDEVCLAMHYMTKLSIFCNLSCNT
jgi:hypothetical protein